MHSLTAPSHSPFIYHFNLFAVSGKTEDTTSQRIQRSKGLLEVTDTWLSEQKTTASTAFPAAEAALPGKSPLSSEAVAQLLLCHSEKVIPGSIHEIKVLELKLIPTQEPGMCSPVLVVYPKSRGAGRSHQDPCHCSLRWDLQGMLQNALALLWNPETICAIKLLEQLQMIDNKKCGIIIY